MKLVIFLFIMIYSVYSVPLQLTPVPTSESISVESLFSHDTCAPPCWFGLTPGQSTSQDVVAFIESSDETIFCCWDTSFRSTFDPTESYVIDGRYSFYWRDYDRPDKDTRQGNSGLRIQDGILDWMQIGMPDIVTLDQILASLREPSRVQFTSLFYRPFVILSYDDLRVNVGLIGDRDACTVFNLRERLAVSNVEYHSLLSYERARGYEDSSPLAANIYDVPLSTWRTWLNNDVTTSCDEAITELQQITMSLH
jgi:hypothetical protein